MSPPKNKKAKSSKKHDSAQAESFIPETQDAEWESHFEKLERFHEQYAHVQVPKRYPPCPELPLWLAAQKTHLADLSRDQIRRLWELGVKFPGTYKHQLWLSQFFKLVEGRECYGNANDPRIWQQNPSLREWVCSQRNHRGRRLVPYRRRLLNEIGFIWGAYDAYWEKRFAELLAFKARFGHCYVPHNWPENPQLAVWLRVQRGAIIAPQRKKRLAKIGAFINYSEPLWEKRFQQWCDYVREFGANSAPKEGSSLAGWVRHQRNRRRKGKLDVKRIWRLEKMGFLWNPLPEQWEGSFRKLERFHQIHGHCRVGEVEGRSNLAQWCWSQVRDRKKGAVSAERIARLDALGFVWNPHETWFEKKLEKLKRYHAAHGHSRVLDKEDLRLSQWIRRVRHMRKKGLLSPEQIRQLDGIIEWDPDETFFEERLEMLKRFYATHGHYRVPIKQDSKLAGWIGWLRLRRKRGQLSAEHIQRLEGLIDWGPLEKSLEKKLKILKQFHATYGHTRISTKDNPKLAKWLAEIRRKYRRGQLSSEYIQKLEELIDWDPRDKK